MAHRDSAASIDRRGRVTAYDNCLLSTHDPIRARERSTQFRGSYGREDEGRLRAFGARGYRVVWFPCDWQDTRAPHSMHPATNTTRRPADSPVSDWLSVHRGLYVPFARFNFHGVEWGRGSRGTRARESRDSGERPLPSECLRKRIARIPSSRPLRVRDLPRGT